VSGSSSLLAAGASQGVPFDLLTDLAVILCVAAATTVLFQRIKQPVILGYLIAGMIVGPHLPIPLFANEATAHQFSEIGVILLMFALGLEFSLRKLVRVGPTVGLVALIECSLMIWLGYVAGRLFGFTPLESLFTGGLVAISSTTIILKAFAEQNVKGKIADFVLGILIGEDLIAILLLAILTPLASGVGLSAGALVWTVAKLATFLIGVLAVGILLVPRFMRFIVRIGRMETTVVVSVGICFGCALLARKFGYSVALGAFLGGALVAESGVVKTIERAMEPIRDLFAAIFFVSVGMLIDPVLVARHWGAVLGLTAVVIVGKVFGVALGSFLAGRSVRTSVQAGMSLAQIGEFSFIIAGVGVTLGATRSFLYPVAVAVSALTTLSTPWLIRASGPVASFVDSRLPPALQTFVSLYGSWVQQLRSTPQHRTAWSYIRKLVGLMLIDMLALAGIVIVASLSTNRLLALAGQHLKMQPELVRWGVVAAVLVLSIPFVLGAIRIARALGAALVAEALPRGTEALDRAAASRRALLVTFQLAILLLAGIPLAAVTQPFVRFPVVLIVLAGVLALVLPFWRSATNLHGHVRAGAQVILESLASQSLATELSTASHEEIRRLVPGLGETSTVRILPGGRSVGLTLKDLDLRAQTGATVIAIERGETDLVYPTAELTLESGDLLVLTGTEEAVTLARDILLGGDPSGRRNGNGGSGNGGHGNGDGGGTPGSGHGEEHGQVVESADNA
jgi:monovalent cation:H+ antiporter-2, CPA2 family